jgi:hypothetical protein
VRTSEESFEVKSDEAGDREGVVKVALSHPLDEWLKERA